MKNTTMPHAPKAASNAPQGIITGYDDEFNGELQNETGITVSIPGALKGESLFYHIEHKSPHAPRAWGRCDGLIQPSSERCKPACDVASSSGGGAKPPCSEACS